MSPWLKIDFFAQGRYVNEFNTKDEVYRKEYFAEKSSEYHKAGYILSSLEYLINARKDRIVFVFPDEYRGDNPSILQRKLDFFVRLFDRGAHY